MRNDMIQMPCDVILICIDQSQWLIGHAPWLGHVFQLGCVTSFIDVYLYIYVHYIYALFQANGLIECLLRMGSSSGML